MADNRQNGGKATKERSVMSHDSGDPTGTSTSIAPGAPPAPRVTSEMPKPRMDSGAKTGAGEQPRSAAATMPRPSMQAGSAMQDSSALGSMPRPQQMAGSASPASTMPRPGMQMQSAGGAQAALQTGTQRESIMPTPPPMTVDGSTASGAHVMQTAQGEVHALVSARAAAGPRVGFDYPATTLRGSTAHFNVYYDSASLPVNGPIIADAVLASCEWEYAMLQSFFDGITPGGLPFNIIIAAGIGGAYHYGCSGVDLYCDGSTAATPDVNHTRMLVIAEEVEVFSAAQAAGWNCAASNGEGLSRVLATQLYPAELGGFESASSWLNAPGRPDFVNVTDATDRNYVSTGCATLFLNFLRHQLQFSWEEITRAAAGTLAQTYTKLTGRTDGFTRFKALVQAYYPEGTAVFPASDNLFPLPGVMELVARGSDGAVYHQTQTAPSNGWTGWSSLGGWVDIIEVAQNDDTRVEIFARGGDGAVWHNWQTFPNNGWSGWASLGGWIDRLDVGKNADGRMEVFARGSDAAVWHIWQTAPSSGWSSWASMGGWVDIISVFPELIG
ncbi:MAG: hypothetical protein NVS2B17_24180 [Candidatus Velthaea sp.]